MKRRKKEVSSNSKVVEREVDLKRDDKILKRMRTMMRMKIKARVEAK
jgi:hypothetical protein